MMATPPTGGSTVRNGLICGLILGLLGLGNSLAPALTGANGVTSWAVTTSGPTSLSGCVLFLAMLALTFGAGLLAAMGTGKVGSGALAGLLSGVVGGLVGGIGSVVIVAVLAVPSLQIPPGSTLTLGQSQALLVGASVVGDVVGLLAGAGFGSGLGALGGLLGANSYRRAHPAPPAMQPGAAPYPYYPSYPVYSGYPPSPGMPTQPGTIPPQPWLPPTQPTPPMPSSDPSSPPPEQPHLPSSPPQD